MVTRDNIGVYIRSRKGKACAFSSAIFKEQESYLVCMQQSESSVANVCVEIGDSVKQGTVIGKPSDRNGCFVYSPVSGKVMDIIQKLSIYGKLVDHVLIFADKKNEIENFPALSEINRKTLLERLMSSGIIDLVGQPSYIKYVRKPSEKARLFISCIDNDPYVSAEEVSVRENMEETIKGAEYFAKLINVSEITFIFSSEQKSAFKAFKNHVKANKIKNVSVRVLDYVYPLSIVEITRYLSGKSLDASGRYYKGIYLESGISAKQFYDAVEKNNPVISRLMTIAGTGFIRKANYEIKNGTSLRAIMDFVGVNNKESTYKMVCGGAMTGVAQESSEATINISNNAILFLTRVEFSEEKESPCINCGKCVDICPARIMPYRIEEYLINGDLDYAKKFGINACTECGACSYICPAKRYLAQRLSDGKKIINKSGGNR